MRYVVSVCELLYFFFFKQKTAYEMRISDWSSDVCSSDLSILHHFAYHADAVGIVPIVLIYGIEPGCGRIRIGQALHPCDTRFFVIMFNRSARSAYFMRTHRSIADEYHLMIVPIFVQNVTSGNRSEEHTYELQSLMRSSYA